MPSRPALLALCALLLLAACSNTATNGNTRPPQGGSSGSPAIPGPTEPASLPPLLPSGPGSSPGDPMEVCMPDGATTYLSQLRCPDGSAPVTTTRINVGTRNVPPDTLAETVWRRMGDPQQALLAGEVDYHVVDRFTVVCGATPQAVYVDVYHCR